MQIDIKTNKSFRIFLVQQSREEIAEMSTEHDEAEPENDQSRLDWSFSGSASVLL